MKKYLLVLVMSLYCQFGFTQMVTESDNDSGKYNTKLAVEVLNDTTMIRKGLLVISDREYRIELYALQKVAGEFIKHLPVISKCNNIGGEIYFRVPGVDLEYDGTQSSEFEIGDIVYWRSPDGEKKFSVAIFYGNTQYSNWKSPRSSSPCVKIGRIVDNLDHLDAIQTGEEVKISFR